MTTQAVAEIRAAWASKSLEGWNPNVTPVVRVMVDEPHRLVTAVEAALVLPPRLTPIRHVVFELQKGLINYVPCWRVVGRLDGIEMELASGPLQRDA